MDHIPYSYPQPAGPAQYPPQTIDQMTNVPMAMHDVT